MPVLDMTDLNGSVMFVFFSASKYFNHEDKERNFMKPKKAVFQVKSLFGVLLVSLFIVGCPSPGSSPIGTLPLHMAGNLSFIDTDPTPGEIGGTVSIVRASHETDFTHYVLYWGSGPNTKMTRIVQLEKTGSSLTYTISPNTSIPAGATYLLVYTKNDGAEMGTCVSLELYDAQNNSGLITIEPVSGWTPRTLIARRDNFNFDHISATFREMLVTMQITNNTTEGLNLEGNPVIAFTDPTPWFIINTDNTADYIAPGGTTTFTVRFIDTSTATGAASDKRSAEIRIENLTLDNAEPISDYIFSISGTSKITRLRTYYSNTNNITFSGFITDMSISVRGGGGGGGGGKGDGSNVLGTGGGGGGAGYLIEETIHDYSLTASVTIGSGGARGTGATQFRSFGTSGTDGGETVLIINGTTYRAGGGKRGGAGGYFGASNGGTGGAGDPHGQNGSSYHRGAGGNSGSDHGSGGDGGNGSTQASAAGENGRAGTSGYVTIQYTGYEFR